MLGGIAPVENATREAAKAVDETAATNDTHMLTVPTLRKRLAELEAERQAALGI